MWVDVVGGSRGKGKVSLKGPRQFWLLGAAPSLREIKRRPPLPHTRGGGGDGT